MVEKRGMTRAGFRELISSSSRQLIFYECNLNEKTYPADITLDNPADFDCHFLPSVIRSVYIPKCAIGHGVPAPLLYPAQRKRGRERMGGEGKFEETCEC
jgi:hypothetical protein